MAETSASDVFRFVQIRPPLSATKSVVVTLLNTTVAERLRAAATTSERVRLANAFLKSEDAIRTPRDLAHGEAIRRALAELKPAPSATTKELLAKLGTIPIDEQFQANQRRLSDTLLSIFFATEGFPADIQTLQDIYRVFDFLVSNARGGAKPIPLSELLARPIVTPFPLQPTQPFPETPVPEPGGAGSSVVHERAESPRAEPAASLVAVIDELLSLDRHRFLNMSRGSEEARSHPLALTAEACQGLSAEALRVLAARNLDAGTVPLHELINELAEEARASAGRRLTTAEREPAPARASIPVPGPFKPYIRAAGIAELLLVKQHLKAYEAVDIAHVENVLIGETKSRSHRLLERTEETFIRETETTHEQQKELETADRYELNRETSQTIRESLNIGVDLSVSGRYGPAVEFSNNFQMDYQRATEESVKNASTFAKNVVSRSLDRITERVREERIRKVTQEMEETNLHELHNKTDRHIRGIYQFLEKVYEAQIFNYGVRQIFDFMVPEPASFIWWMQRRPDSGLSLPPPPTPLDQLITNASEINEYNVGSGAYLTLAARYGALDVDLPPPNYKMLIVGSHHGQDDASETGQPHSSTRLDVTIPEGYRPVRAEARLSTFSDNDPRVSVTIQRANQVWNPFKGVDLSAGHHLQTDPTLLFDLTADSHDLTDQKLGVSLMAWETNTYTVDLNIVCARTVDGLARWKLATYKKIRQAYEEKVRQYEQTVKTLRAESEARIAAAARDFGRAPSENQITIRNELKKHCLSIMTQQWFDSFSATDDGTPTRPPQFDLQRAEDEGSFIRFFEQAFEWEQTQWIFYPYFWARRDTWPDRFARQDVDPVFREFVQAGAARVVVPVRPGFEVAITHFVETGKIWSGTGTPPDINSPLYVSIIEEIRDRTNAPKGEKPVGESWDVRLPTPLVYLRGSTDLPKWRRVAGKDWQWEPVPESP